LLGAKYGDFYRRAKIQETVFELLTGTVRACESARSKRDAECQSARSSQNSRKEIVSTTLDDYVSRHISDSRIAVVWVMGSSRWEAIDALDPRKVLLSEWRAR